MMNLVRPALEQAARIRKCEQRPGGHFDVETANEELGGDLYQAVVCCDCGRVRLFGEPLPLPSGVTCQHCAPLPEPTCEDDCHPEHDRWNIRQP